MQTTDVEILKGLISLIKVNNGKFSDDDIKLLKGINKIINERWITIHPHGDDSEDYRRIKLEDGETPKEAIERVYKKNNKNKNEKIEKNQGKEIERLLKIKEKSRNEYFKLNNELRKNYEGYKKGKISGNKIREIAAKVNTAKNEYLDCIQENKKYIIENSKPLEDNAKIANVIKESPMDFDKANRHNSNPNFLIKPNDEKYNTNCQSCVVAYEARRRGYNVQAVERNKYNKTQQLAEYSSYSFIDPKTNKPCEFDSLNPTNSLNLYNKLEKTVLKGQRYLFRYTWFDGKNSGGHIVTIERDEHNELALYDPQIGKRSYKQEMTLYFKNYLKYNGSSKIQILRVDDKPFNDYFVNDGVLKSY